MSGLNTAWTVRLQRKSHRARYITRADANGGLRTIYKRSGREKKRTDVQDRLVSDGFNHVESKEVGQTAGRGGESLFSAKRIRLVSEFTFNLTALIRHLHL